MTAPTRTFVIVAVLASSACGQRFAQDDVDEGSDSGTDTDALPDECPTTDLILSEPYSGSGIAGVLFAAAEGGTNHVTSSCGGGGVDQAYLVTSQKTANYELSVFPGDFQSPLTVHVHAGDSCNGPELYCATGTDHHYSFSLGEGETVTVVVDTEPGLPIPADGLPYQVGLIWGPENYPPCDAESLQACNAAASDELEACMAGDSCTDLDQDTMCTAAFADAMQGCVDTFCPSQGGISWDACDEPCATQRSSCALDNGCDPHTCTYQWQMCMDTCHPCTWAEFEFEYTGGCELNLPGPPLGIHADYTIVEIAGQEQPLADPGLACDEFPDPVIVWASESTMLLCGSICDTFATVGVATVVYGMPPCE